MKKLIISLLIMFLVTGCGSKFNLDRSELDNGSSWAFYRKDLRHTGSITGGQFSGKLDLVWRFKSNDKPAGPISLNYDLLVYPGARNRLKFIDAQSGEYRGYIKGKGSSSIGVVIEDSLAFYSYMAPDGKLRCINLLNRKKLWVRKVKDAPIGSIIYKNILFIGFNDGNIAAINRVDGSLIWERQLESRISVPLLIVEDQICQAADDRMVYFIDPKTGADSYQIELAYPANTLPVYDDITKQLFIAGYKGELTSVDCPSGTINWSGNIEQPIWAPMSLTEKQLFVAHNGGTVYALDKMSGQILWKYPAGDVVFGGLLSVDRFLVFGTLKGDLYCLSQVDGEVIDKKKLKGPLQVGPISNGKYVYVADNRGQISCFGENNEQE